MNPEPKSEIREVVALFDSREAFRATTDALLADGFDHADLSVLSSHESLGAAEEVQNRLSLEAAMSALGWEELTWAFPLTAAGLMAVVGGPVTAVIGGLMAAGIAGAAVSDYIGDLTAKPHTKDFARALEAGGAILWVRVATDDAETRASAILATNGGQKVHVVKREAA